jgi:hypothetical protein
VTRRATVAFSLSLSLSRHCGLTRASALRADPSCCEGGGGATPVVDGGQVYVRDDFCDPTTGLVLDANTGNTIGGFNSDTPPAFIGNLALYFQGGTLVGVDIPSGQQLWSFAGDGGLTSAPVIVNQTIYIGSSSGTLFGLSTSGQQIWSTQVGAPIPFPDEGNAIATTGLGSGDALLIVPTESTLVAYGPCNRRCAPIPRPRPTPAPLPWSARGVIHGCNLDSAAAAGTPGHKSLIQVP